ncbi:MAG: outer membrane beta-barrel protein [Acidobacteria bacterium]|nr:outer membrane beta-barrel protein [Acidobacteriota bacterium]
MRKIGTVLLFFACLAIGHSAFAQGIDFAFGVSALKSTSNYNASTGTTQQVGGGAFPGISGDFLFKKDVGVQGEVYWRATRNAYDGFQPFRPILWDFNAIYAPRVGRVGGELMAGIGALSSRFYQNTIVSCGVTGCTNYVSSNHFDLHFGGGIKLYIMKSVFIRPEAHYYYVRNNDVDFTSNNVFRVGASIGFSFGR